MEKQDLKRKFSSYVDENEGFRKEIKLAYFHQNKAIDQDRAALIEQLLLDSYGDNLIVCKKALIQQRPIINYAELHSILNKNLKAFFDADHKSFDLYSNGYPKQSLSVYAHCFEKMLDGYSNLSEHELSVVRQSFLSTMLCENSFGVYKKERQK